VFPHDVDNTLDLDLDVSEEQKEVDATTAEQYILSHLASAAAGDHAEARFEDFMPAGEGLLEEIIPDMRESVEGDVTMEGVAEIERTVGDEAIIDPTLREIQPDQDLESLKKPDPAQIPLSNRAKTKGIGRKFAVQPSVLSRLRRGAPGSCDICGRTETSVWRKLTLGNEDHKVCNGMFLHVRIHQLIGVACGLYHTKFGVIRPPELWGDGTGVKKRRPGSTIRSGSDAPKEGEGMVKKKTRKRTSLKDEGADSLAEAQGASAGFADHEVEQDEEGVVGAVEAGEGVERGGVEGQDRGEAGVEGLRQEVEGRLDHIFAVQ
jgi:hypothetical protein